MTQYTGYTAQVTLNGEVYPIERNVAHIHPEQVHEALGTEGSEAALQGYLDEAYVGDWYEDATGGHLGPDPQGLELFWLDADGKPVHCLPD
jgi:hypothetical protein